MFVHTGDYTEHKTDTPLRLTYYTFTPRPLMDGGFYTMTDDMESLLVAAHRAIGIIEGMFLSFHEGETLAELMSFKESCFNRMIDYPDLDLKAVLLNRGLSETDDEIDNIVSAYRVLWKTGEDTMNFNDIARYALYGNGSKQKVGTRDSQIFLSKSISNYRQYNPSAPKDIHSAMNDIDRYTELDGTDVLIKAAMCHYQFEMIHPYERYNGIIGRLFIYKMMRGTELSGTQFLSLSECLYNHKAEYFEKLGQTQKSGNYTAWVEFFIRIIYEAAQNGIKSAQYYINTMHSDEEKIACSKSNLQHLTSVYNYFKKNIVSNVNQISSRLQLSFNVASRAIETLQRLGILTQVTEQSRNRLFVHTGLLRLLVSEEG